jgi:hypothetical protein
MVARKTYNLLPIVAGKSFLSEFSLLKDDFLFVYEKKAKKDGLQFKISRYCK